MESEPPIDINNETDSLKPVMELRPLPDALVEAHGFAPRSQYVEVCWLPILGPTATWLYRRLGSWAEATPEGINVDLVDLGVSLGLGEGLGRNSLLAKSLSRLVRFDAARWQGDSLAVRRALAPLPERQTGRLSFSAYRYHRQSLEAKANENERR